MTISSIANRASAAGNGSTTAFAFPYLFFANDDLKVILVVDSTGVETVQTITTHYTVTGAGASGGGTVTMGTAPASGQTLVILREEQYTQTLDLVENDPFPSSSVERALDSLTMLAQQLNDDASRTVKLSDGDTSGADVTLPTPVAGGFITFNAAGNALTTSTTSAAQWLGGSDGTVSLPYYTFASDPDTGLYRIGTGSVGIAKNGVTDGEVVGTTGTQTLTNKTMTAPTVNGVVGGTTTSQTITTLTSTDVNSTNLDGIIGADTARAGTFTDVDVLQLTVRGATPATQYHTLDSNATAARTWRFPDASDTSVGLGTTDTLTNKTLTSPVLNTGVSGTAILDEDNLVSNSATKLATQQSIKAYVDTATTTLTNPVINTGVSGTAILDEDNLVSNSATKLATQQSIKAYVDTATAASAVWDDVVYLTNSNSPYTVTGSQNGTLFAVDASGGAVTVNLPAISGLGSTVSVGIKKTDTGANNVTVTPNGSDEIDEAGGSITIGVTNSGRVFLSDTDTAPDSWTTIQFGPVGATMTVQNYADGVNYTSGTTSSLTTSSAAGSEDNVIVTFDGVTQHHNTYTVSGTTVTFDAAIPLGAASVEIRYGATLAINTPGTNTVTTATLVNANVTTAKIADANVTTAKIADANVTTAKIADDAVTLAKMAGGTDGELITWDASGNPAAVAVGTATHILTSNGVGVAPTFQAPAALGALASLNTVGAAQIDNSVITAAKLSWGAGSASGTLDGSGDATDNISIALTAYSMFPMISSVGGDDVRVAAHPSDGGSGTAPRFALKNGNSSSKTYAVDWAYMN